MEVLSIQALSAYGSTAQSVTTPRQFRELAEMQHEASVRDAQVAQEEVTQRIQRVQPVGQVLPKQPIKPKGPHHIDVRI